MHPLHPASEREFLCRLKTVSRRIEQLLSDPA